MVCLHVTFDELLESPFPAEDHEPLADTDASTLGDDEDTGD